MSTKMQARQKTEDVPKRVSGCDLSPRAGPNDRQNKRAVQMGRKVLTGLKKNEVILGAARQTKQWS